MTRVAIENYIITQQDKNVLDYYRLIEQQKKFKPRTRKHFPSHYSPES